MSATCHAIAPTRLSRPLSYRPRPRPRHSFGLAYSLLATTLLCGTIVCPDALADRGLIDRVGSLLDDVARGLNLLGEKAEDLVGPGLGFGLDHSGPFSEARELEERYPVRPDARVSISNEFGEIRVGTWANDVVQVHALVTVDAESPDLATELCRGVNIHASAAVDNAVVVRTILPDTRSEMGRTAIAVDYVLTIPQDASLIAENSFGDTFVSGIGGALALDARYGLVEIRDVSGPTTVRSRGEFDLLAEHLDQGGTFQLDGARATFSRVSGPLRVSAFRGSVSVPELASETTADITAESGSIDLSLANGSAPYIDATALFGNIQSDIPLDRTTQGNFIRAVSYDTESSQSLSLQVRFGDILIHQQSGPDRPPLPTSRATHPFKDVLSETRPIPQDTPLRIEAATGDVRITGIDEDTLYVTATKLIRVQALANARAALQALDFALENTPQGLMIRTGVSGDLAAIGCTSHRVDLEIRCPRTLTIHVLAVDGQTTISDTGGAVSVTQKAGTISIEHVKAPLTLINEKGDVHIAHCAGPIDLTASYGTTLISNIFGKINARCLYGKAVIEAPHGELTLQGVSADARIIALEGIKGNFDVKVEQGNLSILIPPSADATLSLAAEEGAVHSAIALSGTIQKGQQKFIGTLNKGTYQVALKTIRGNIILD